MNCNGCCDFATKDMLTKALADFEGAMIFVSHDRSVLRGLSNRGLELGGGGGPRQCAGGYAEYVVVTGYEAPGGVSNWNNYLPSDVLRN